MQEKATVIEGYKLSKKVSNACILIWLVSIFVFGASFFVEVPQMVIRPVGIFAIIAAVIVSTTKLSIWVKMDQ